MISVSLDDEGLLQQEGSGPNFQGDRLTQCTCQRIIRAEKKNPKEWLDGWWIAGFTSPKLCGRLWLFYLAKVEQVYASQAELWEAMPELRAAKSTRRNRLGDLYQPDPATGSLDPFDPAYYYPPIVGHSHRPTAADGGWKKDIDFYHPTFQRRPVLLVAKPELTCLWQTPLLYLKDHPRNKTWDSPAALLTKLIEAV
jgi:hypothetical protein